MSIKSILWGISFAAFLLSACSNPKPNQTAEPDTAKEPAVVVERTSFPSSPLDSVYHAIRPAVQQYSIKPTKTQKIKSTNGTEVLIPANSFIDGYGNLVTENVEIEIIEAVELTDFLTCNLQTLSNDQVLESAGMLFIDAKSNGQSLRLAEGQKISISMPMMKAEPGFQMFTGKTDEDGTLNWMEDRSADKDYLIPFPADVLYTEKMGYLYPYSEYGYYYGRPSFDTIKFDPKSEKYVNTLIQTREFKNRIWKLSYATHILSTLMNKDLKWEDREGINLDVQLYELYFSNHQTPIEVLDSTANAILNSYMSKPAFKEWLQSDQAKKWPFHWPFNDVDEKIWRAWIDFGGDRAKGTVTSLKDYGVDLSLTNAYDSLIAKGAGQDEALMILNIEKERSQYIKEIRRAREIEEEQIKTQKFVQNTVFTTSELGWINCDRFLNDPTAGKAEIMVSIDSDSLPNYVDCSLIIPELNVKLSAYPKGSDQYTFTKKDGMYTNLPIGKDAIIVAISLIDGQVQFSSQKIKIEDRTTVSLKMEPIAKSELKRTIDELLSPEA